MPVVGAPEIQVDLALGPFAIGAVLLALPGFVSLLLEATLLASTDRIDRRPLLAGALAGTAATSLLAAMAWSPWTLVLALGVWGTANGIAFGAGQAALVAASPDPDRALTRWTLFATIGDLAAPALLALCGSWRLALVLTAVLPALDALAVATGPPLRGEPEDEEETLSEALRAAVRDRPLIAWLLAATSCTLMDEIILVYTSLRLDALGATPADRAVQLTACLLGSLVGVAAMERWPLDARRTLLGSALLTSVALTGWLANPTWPWLFVTGIGIAPMYPLTKAAAYARRPDRPGLVGALDQVIGVLDLCAPLVIGAVAVFGGLELAIAALLAQPLVVALVATLTGPRRVYNPRNLGRS
ncbi:MAG: MFS transporter [Deltaproteobacteria bacterium]|nr:MFS transporter [Deltaproteobacteria bacterium]